MLCVKVAVRHALRDLNLLLRVQKRHLTDFFQIHADRIVDVDAFGACEDGFDLCDFLVDILRNLDFLDDIDVQVFEFAVNLVHLIGVDPELVQRVHDFVVGQNALLLAGFQQFADLLIRVHRLHLRLVLRLVLVILGRLRLLLRLRLLRLGLLCLGLLDGLFLRFFGSRFLLRFRRLGLRLCGALRLLLGFRLRCRFRFDRRARGFRCFLHGLLRLFGGFCLAYALLFRRFGGLHFLGFLCGFCFFHVPSPYLFARMRLVISFKTAFLSSAVKSVLFNSACSRSISSDSFS